MWIIIYDLGMVWLGIYPAPGKVAQPAIMASTHFKGVVTVKTVYSDCSPELPKVMRTVTKNSNPTHHVKPRHAFDQLHC